MSPADTNRTAATPATRLVGRREELARIHAMIERGARLVTIWGPAGMGKTRLALEVAAAERERFASVVVCELAEARDADSLRRVVARALDLRLAAPATEGELAAQIGEALAARGAALVVLDNLEQVLVEATAALELWTRAAPEVVWVATSRERTRIARELAIELEPLRVRGPGLPEAVELFLDRIGRRDDAAARPLAEAVAPLVERLEGIPLAIELAASRFELLGLEGTMARLGSQLDLLAERRGRPARQATLRGALEWSWELCDATERRALARLAVFRGGFTAEAGEAVLSDLGPAPLDRLEALRERSLVRVARRDELSAPRFGLFETMREFARDKLAASGEERERAQEAHAAYFLALGERQLEQYEETGARAAVDALAAEIENLLAVVEEALARGDGDIALRAALVVDVPVTTRGPFGAHLARLARALELAEREASPSLLSRGLTALGRAKLVAGFAVEAEALLSRALAVAERAGDDRLEAAALLELGIALHKLPDLEGAERLYERALALARSRGALRAEARALGNLGAVHHDARRFDAAIERYERALALLAAGRDGARDVRLLGVFSTNLGVLEQERGAVKEAERRYASAVAYLEEAADARLLAIALGSLGSLQHEEGQLARAIASQERALGLLRETGDRRSEALGLARLGAALASAGQRDASLVAVERADRLAAALGDPLVAAASDLSRAFLELASARRALGERRRDSAEASIASAEARAAKVRSGSVSAADRSDDVRALLRLFERTLAATTAAPRPDAGALLVAPETRWMRPPRGAWQDLRQRDPARRLLAELIAAQRDRPGVGLGVEALRDAAWPGERMTLEAARNRVYVAMNQLRRLGLKDLLRRGGGGYLLDPAVHVHAVAVDPDVE